MSNGDSGATARVGGGGAGATGRPTGRGSGGGPVRTGAFGCRRKGGVRTAGGGVSTTGVDGVSIAAAGG